MTTEQPETDDRPPESPPATRDTGVLALAHAREVLRIEAAAILTMSDQLTDAFADAVRAVLNVRGRIIVSGMAVIIDQNRKSD